jgi:hypothetical protein
VTGREEWEAADSMDRMANAMFLFESERLVATAMATNALGFNPSLARSLMGSLKPKKAAEMGFFIQTIFWLCKAVLDRA